MANITRKNSQHLQYLHDFYEPLVILRVLGPCIGPRNRTPPPKNIPGEQARQDFHTFLNRLCWLCDYEPGGETVNAIGFEKSYTSNIAWLSTSHAVFREVETQLAYLIEQIKGIDAFGADRLERLEHDICVKCIGFANKRVTRYSKLCHEQIENCYKTFQSSDPLLARDLRNLMNLMANPLKLCAAADRFRDSESLKRLSQWISGTSSSLDFLRLRHFIGRLGSWHRASRTLVDYAHKNPELFLTVQVRTIVTLKPIHAPRVDEFTTLDSSLSRMYTKAEQNDLKLGVQTVQNIRRLDLSNEFQQEYRKKTFKPRVHAEVWLLEHFASNKLRFLNNDRYIGCSKPSCYCCNLYFQDYPGGFETRSSHGNVWTNWQFPTQPDATRSLQDSAIMSAMIRQMRDDLKRLLKDPSSRQTRQPDSTNGFTISNA